LAFSLLPLFAKKITTVAKNIEHSNKRIAKAICIISILLYLLKFIDYLRLLTK